MYHVYLYVRVPGYEGTVHYIQVHMYTCMYIHGTCTRYIYMMRVHVPMNVLLVYNICTYIHVHDIHTCNDIHTYYMYKRIFLRPVGSRFSTCTPSLVILSYVVFLYFLVVGLEESPAEHCQFWQPYMQYW